MALKLSLKPHERLILGGPTVLMRNGRNAGELIIENKVPVLIRGTDIMAEKDAYSPCRRIYFIIQLMYIDENNLKEYHAIYWKQVQAVLKAAPSMLGILSQISEHVLNGKYYNALKTARKLIGYEYEIIQHLQSP